MARRQLNHKQQRAVQRIQSRRQQRARQFSETALDELEEGPLSAEQSGRLIVNYGRAVVVEDDAGNLHNCIMRRNLGDLACGDRVVFQTSAQNLGVVSALLPRNNVLERPDYSGRLKPLAANLDQLFIVLAPKPEFVPVVVDRFLVAAELSGVEAHLLLNKTDLLGADQALAERLADKLAPYTRMGYPLLQTSAKTGGGEAELRAGLIGRSSMLVGQSGVGKSSLINHLLPDRDVRVGGLSETSGKGRHTTSTTTLYHLPDGGELIDSPGVWEFGLPPMDADRLAWAFADIRPHLGHCRFNDCRHRDEPECAVKRAEAEGLISSERLASYFALVAELCAGENPGVG